MGLSYNESDIISIEDTVTGLQMLDKFSRIKDGRRIEPLDALDNVFYPHRYLYDEYNLQIGDTYFMIPPEFIMVSSESTSQSLVTLRQENTQKMKAGHHKRTILIDLVFNGLEQLNGYPVSGPEGTYYVDGLRQLLAQFKCTPFLPISNEMINGMYGIFTVALQSITMSTMQGFPNVMTAQITLQEVNMYPYIEMPDVCFKYMIDWDLFRFYYQRFLTEEDVYKKLKSLSAGSNHDSFKISILSDAVFNTSQATESNMLDIICDKNKVVLNEDGTTADSNYVTWLDSTESDVVITSFQCGYSNILTNIQLSDISTPTVQFIGGMDTIYSISLETTDYSVVQALEQCQISNDLLIRNNAKIHSVGFVKLESELVAFTGSLFVLIDSVTTNTVPGFPGLYNVQMNCIAYDIAQSSREQLHGFRPFDCDDCEDNDFNPDHVHSGEDDKYANQTIEQSMDGLKIKIRQDNYAEWKIRTTMEVYPDLHLPTYAEVNEFIGKCIAFRRKHDLTKLPYLKYPTNPTALLHGCHPDNKIQVKDVEHGIAYTDSIDKDDLEYNIYVDPDFYVFYPCSYLSFHLQELEESGSEYYSSYTPKHPSSFTERLTTYTAPNYTGEASATELIDQFISSANDFIGHTYVWGAEGEISDAKGLCFDCSGFVTYLLKKIGVMPTSWSRLTVATIPSCSLFTEVSWDEMQRGDIVCNSEMTHVVIYEGDNQIVHAANSSPYPDGGVKKSNLYFTSGRCFRPNAFMKTATQQTVTASTNAGRVWNMLKSYGLSDFAAAAILGNMQQESGVNPANLQNEYEKTIYPESEYTTFVNNGYYQNFVNDGAGYGLVQFTYPAYKKQLLDEAKKRNVGIENLELQVDVMISQIKSEGVFDKLNAALSIKEASNIFMLKYERPGDQSEAQQNKRANYAEQFYEIYKGTSGTPLATEQRGYYTLTQDEFESICKVVAAETLGEDEDAQRAMAQLIYDRLTHPSKKFGGLSNILTGENQFNPSYQGVIDQSLSMIVRKVFCNGEKHWKNAQIWYFLTPDANYATITQRDIDYDRIGEAGLHVFWGEESKGSDIQYHIVDNPGTGSASNNALEEAYDVLHNSKTIKDIKRFAEPVLAKTDAIIYDDTWAPWNNATNKKNAKEYLNEGINIFNTMFCDEFQYSARGRLVRAFPTYLFCILDDHAQWYDGRKLWTNYYIHRSVVDIAVHGTNDMPVETATLTITNSYHNLDRTQGGLNDYSIVNDEGYTNLQRKIYETTGLLLGLGPKLTDKLIKLQQIIYNHAKLREGARIHLRIGYGSDPLGLAPVMNGHVSDVALGDQITIVVTSDGHELIQHVTSANEKDTNNGLFGLFGLGEKQEASNIISSIMAKRQSWFHYLAKETFEGSAYGIEHFGLYFNQEVMRLQGGVAYGLIGLTIGTLINPGLGSLIGLGIGTLLGAIVGTLRDDLTIADIWNGVQEQYDLLKNIYKADYSREHYIYTDVFGKDDEYNFVFCKYNMTPWDEFQMCTQQAPEYIIKPSYHQFDSRLYFGLPFWMEKYRYNYLNKEVYEECKSAAQVHLLDCTNIIDNQVKVTSKFSNTNVKVMYTRGSKVVSTPTIHSDDTIDFAYQKTQIIDSPIVQDAFGPDLIYEVTFYSLGEDSAMRVGVSNLLYGWQQQYQGQILLTGCSGIKAHDYVMIHDNFTNMYGIALVREVTHSFSINTGFTTSLTLGMIGFHTERHSGMIQTCQSLLGTLNCFSSYIETRRALRNNYEQNLSLFANVEILQSKMNSAVSKSQMQQNHITGWNVVGTIGEIGFAIYNGAKIYKNTKATFGLAKKAKTTANMLKVVDKIYDTYKIAKGSAKGISATLKAIKTSTIILGGSATGGIGSLVLWAVWAVVDVLLDELFTWLANRNVCVLLPLWWNEYPFVSGIKGGENILLIRQTPTDDNTGGEAPDFND